MYAHHLIYFLLKKILFVPTKADTEPRDIIQANLNATVIFPAGPLFQYTVIASENSNTHPVINTADTKTKSLPKTVCPVCGKMYVYNGYFLRHIIAKHLDKQLEILVNQTKEGREVANQVRVNNCMEMDGMDRMDIYDILPAGAPIFMEKIEYHKNEP